MNRPIKFRIPQLTGDGVFEKFLYWGLTRRGEPVTVLQGQSVEFPDPKLFYRWGWSQQFSGKTDSKGIEIYEGDILRQTDTTPEQKPEAHYFQGEYWMEDGSEPFTPRTRIKHYEVFYDNCEFQVKSLYHFRTCSGDDNGKPWIYGLRGLTSSEIEVVGHNLAERELLKEEI